MVQLVRNGFGISCYTYCNDLVASNYFLIVCSVSPQIISDLRSPVLGLTVSLDSETHETTSYMYLRVRHTIKLTNDSVYILDVSQSEQHTGNSMLSALVKFRCIWFIIYTLNIPFAPWGICRLLKALWFPWTSFFCAVLIDKHLSEDKQLMLTLEVTVTFSGLTLAGEQIPSPYHLYGSFSSVFPDIATE